MAKNVDIPALGESVNEAVLLRWMKADGDPVRIDESLCELETDKANVELPSPSSGIMKRVAKEGDTVKIGQTIARIEEAAAASQSPAPSKTAPVVPAKAPGGSPTPIAPAAPINDPVSDLPLSPSVRRLVREHQVEPETLTGTGPRGRVVKEDVLRAAEGTPAAAAVASIG